MIIYQGIQLVYGHVVQLLNCVSTWWSNIEWSVYIDILPINFRPFVSAFLVILLAMACIGLVKKLSFLLG